VAQQAQQGHSRGLFLEASHLLQEAHCPLSLEPFHDPVLAADGHTHSRAEIEGEQLPICVAGCRLLLLSPCCSAGALHALFCLCAEHSSACTQRDQGCKGLQAGCLLLFHAAACSVFEPTVVLPPLPLCSLDRAAGGSRPGADIAAHQPPAGEHSTVPQPLGSLCGGQPAHCSPALDLNCTWHLSCMFIHRLPIHASQ